MCFHSIVTKLSQTNVRNTHLALIAANRVLVLKHSGDRRAAQILQWRGGRVLYEGRTRDGHSAAEASKFQMRGCERNRYNALGVETAVLALFMKNTADILLEQ